MPGSLSRAAPIRFLVGVTLAWITARGIALMGWTPAPASQGGGAMHRVVAARRAGLWPAVVQASPTTPAARLSRGAPIAKPRVIARSSRPDGASATSARAPDGGRSAPASGPLPPPTDHGERRGAFFPLPSGHAQGVLAAGHAGTKTRWSGSAWLFARGGGRATGLAPGGQIGGGQAGARILYRLDGSGILSAAGRVSAALGGVRQTEAAVGIDVRPFASLPVHLMAERRIAIDRGGRNAWTLGVAGGVYDVAVAPGWRLDGYAEAGVVGARRRDLYADGALRIARAIGLGHGRALAAGGGVWGAAQPGAARFDVGPSIVLRLPVAKRTVALALDWRERLAGGARPGSGPAFTLATDF